MYDYACIEKIDKDGIHVIPLMTEHCMGCSNHCDLEQGKPFIVENPQQLEIKKSQFVKISANRKAQGKQASIVLLIPIVFAVLGWLAVNWIGYLTGTTIGEGLHVLAVLLGALIPMLFIFGISHKKVPDASYIEKIVDTNLNEIRDNACLTHL
jgi:hypothetical protein